MGDRVRFFGRANSGATLPVGPVAFWGYPFRFAPPVFDGDHNAPVAVTLARACKWWWRVKTWAITTDATVSDGTDTVTIPSTPMIEPGVYPPATRERDLAIRANQPRWFSVYGGGDETAVLQLGAALARDGDNAYPSLAIFGGIFSSDGSGNSGRINFSSYETILSHDASFVGSIDGVPIRIYTKTAIFGTGTAGMSTFDITPVEFWPYATKDGHDIYDTTTGNILPGRSPLD